MRFAIGDIHGNYKALIQCLIKSCFNYEEDELICLGDVCDGYSEVKKCINELLKINNLKFVLGNHDKWALKWFNGDDEMKKYKMWVKQGGDNTLKSYDYNLGNVPFEHIKLFNEALFYYVDCDNNLYVHGGYDWNEPIEHQDSFFLMWDRDLVHKARDRQYFHEKCNHPNKPFGIYKNIFVGHTTTQNFGTTEPLRISNVTMLDTGAGWDGPLTIMNTETGEFWQSQIGKELYGSNQGRM